MNLSDNKIKDYSLKIKKKSLKILLGGNGQGKSRFIKNEFKRCKGKKVFWGENSPSILKSLCSIIEPDYIDSASMVELSNDEIKCINKLIGKNYKKMRYQVVNISEIFALEDLNQINNLIDNNLEEISLYCFDIETEDGDYYKTKDMGMGERTILTLYLELTMRKETKFFIDEPLNFLSTSTAYTFAKLLLFSTCINNNNFVISTNSLEIIDILVHFNCKFSICLISRSSKKLLTKFGFYRYYLDRYLYSKEFINSNALFCFVEDDLAKKLVTELTSCVEFATEVISVNGDGALNNIAKIIGSKIFPTLKAKCIYDGNIKPNRWKSYQLNLPIVDVEDETINLLKNQFFIFSKDFSGKQSEILNIISQNEKHDAYIKIKNVTKKDDLFFITTIIDHHRLQFETFVRQLIR